MRITVVGGTGFVGSAVVAALSGNHDVLAVGLPDGRDAAARHRTVEADVLADDDVLAGVLAEADIVVYALAPRARGEHLGPAMISAAERVARAAVHAGVRRWLHLSNVSVYASGPGWIDDTTPPAPEYPLGHATLRMEQNVERLLAARDGQTTFLRLGAVFARDGLRGVSHSYVKRGDNWVSHVEREDVASALNLLIDLPSAPVYVVGDTAPMRSLDAARLAAGLRGRTERSVTREQARRFGPDTYGVLTSSVRLRPNGLLAARWRPAPLRSFAEVSLDRGTPP